jgi:orotate phosphoribosyltransferase
VSTTDAAPAANLLARAIAAYATFEGLLVAELVAGNAIGGTPMAACGRVALGMACTLARSFAKENAGFGSAKLAKA